MRLSGDSGDSPAAAGVEVDPGELGALVGGVWVWVVVHPSGGESIGVFRGKDGAAMALMTSDEGQAGRMREIARRLAAHSGRPVRLVRLARAEVVDEVAL